MLFQRAMGNQPAAKLSSNLLVRVWPWVLVLLVLLFAGFIRGRLLETPLERDEGEYAYAGQLILQGIPPYELAYNMKLPGTYFAYATGMAVFGQTIAGIHLTLIVANSLTIVLMFLLGRKLFGVIAGLVTCASYAVMSVSPAVMGLAAHATQFVVLFAVPATLLLLKAQETRRRGLLFFSALLYGLAFLMKQQGLVFGAFGGAFLVWQAARDQSFFSTDGLKGLLIFGSGIFLPFGLTCAGLAAAGVFHQFWFWTFTYAHSYVTAMPLADGLGLLRSNLAKSFDLFVGFWVILAVGLPLALLDKKLRSKTALVLFFSGCSFLGTAVGFYFRPHYYVLMLPALALLQGLAIVAMRQALRFRALQNVLQTLPLILFAFVIAWFIFYQSQSFFRLSPVQVCENLYNSNPFVESLPVARYIREHSPDTARIAVIGSEPQIYFYAQRHSATGYIYTYALMEPQPNALAMQQEMMKEIEAIRPEYLVYVSFEFSWMFNPKSDRTILRWFDDYAGKFYERVGMVQPGSGGKPSEVWGPAAEQMPAPANEYIAIYKRKPVPFNAANTN